MNDTVSVNNLKKAHRIRQSGYKSLLDSRPAVTKAFLELWQEGNSLRKSRDKLLEEFHEEDVPSINALNNYLKNHLQDTVQGKKAEHRTRIEQFDSVKEMYAIAYESKKLYQKAVAARLGMSTCGRLLKQMQSSAEALLKMELQLGLRSPDGTPYEQKAIQQEVKSQPTAESRETRRQRFTQYNDHMKCPFSDEEVEWMLDAEDKYLANRSSYSR